MQTCTECGTAISPAVGPPVLKDGNVVCQPCWQRDEAESEAQPPRPVSKPTSRVSATRRGAPPPGPSRRPTGAATSATPAARRSSTREEAAPAKASRATSRRPGAAPARDAAQPYRAPSRTAALIEEVESSTSGERIKLYIIIAMCAFVIIAGIVGYMFFSDREAKRKAAEDAEVTAAGAMDHIERLMKAEPDNHQKILDEIGKANEKVAAFPERKAQLSTWESNVRNKQAKAATEASNLKLLEEIKSDLEDPAKYAAVRVKLDRARVVAGSMPDDYKKEVQRLDDKLLLNTLMTGVDEAKSKEASGDLPAALEAYDQAVQKFTKQFDLDGGRPRTPEILELYKQLVASSDLLVDRLETPEYEAQVPERDLLSPRERKEWGTSDGAEFNFSGREVELKGVEVEGKKIMGVVSFAGWTPPWHDVVVDLNFTIISGRFELYLRYWPTRRWYQLNFGPDAGYELNKPYQVTLRVKGSTVEMMAPDQPVQTGQMDPNTARTGGVGFGLPPGSKVIISSCKLKVLRPRS